MTATPNPPDLPPTRLTPLCFVVMPFGRKEDATGMTVEFDAVYREFIAPAVRAAGLEPIRADEELAGGIIHKPMFERLILCEYAVADLTFANANVFYELGVRHAVRPRSTVLVYAQGTLLPFDVQPDRRTRYALDDRGRPQDAAGDAGVLTERLLAARQDVADSPVYQLIEGYPEVDPRACDSFRDRVHRSERWLQRLADARETGLEAVIAMEAELGPIEDVESALVLELFRSYGDLEAYQLMVELADRMTEPLARTRLVREQLGHALNRLGRRRSAEDVIRGVIEELGPSSETYGLLGRIYKDQWDDAVRRGERTRADGMLDKAIDAYLRGFETDWRDAYPGVNALTLMELRGAADAQAAAIMPVVAYSVARRIANTGADYWDYATRLELAVLEDDPDEARSALRAALAVRHYPWQRDSTADNLGKVRRARRRRGHDVSWLDDLEQELRG